MTSSASRHAPDCWDTTPTLSPPGNILNISAAIPPTVAPTLWLVIVAPLYAPLCAPAALGLQCNKIDRSHLGAQGLPLYFVWESLLSKTI